MWGRRPFKAPTGKGKAAKALTRRAELSLRAIWAAVRRAHRPGALSWPGESAIPDGAEWRAFSSGGGRAGHENSADQGDGEGPGETLARKGHERVAAAGLWRRRAAQIAEFVAQG
jgi:hypothetical protein